ncbi:hypothetical protein BDL97_10G019900 [Sphagnum fallax]|nr:hypothetical protein BDL97_10G019900 [Sphagnum fallax]
MEAPVGGGQGSRQQWRRVTDGSQGRERLLVDSSGNSSARLSGGGGGGGRPRSGGGDSAGHRRRRSSKNGRIFHPGSSGHSSDSDNNGGGPASPGELLSQTVGSEGDGAALYDELQKDHKPRSFAVLQSGLVAAATEAPEEVLEQRLHDIATQREQLQQAEVELRACFIARSEVIQMQNTFDEQSKQHSHIVVDLQVWVKDGLLREQSNEIAALRQEHENAVAEHKAAEARLDAEREDLLAQLEHLKGQVHEKERQVQEADEQNRTTQDMLLFKDSQLQDAQAWMARAQELNSYHVNANNTLHAELRDRSEQLNQLWIGYQRQLADMERYHTQVIQGLQLEVNEARGLNRINKSTATDYPDAKDEVQTHADNNNSKDSSQHEGSNGTGIKYVKVPQANSGMAIHGNPVLLSHATVEQATGLPVGPTPIMVGVSPVMPSPVHQFGLPHQSATSVTQSLPSLVPQSSLMQPHVLPSAMVPLQQLPLVSEQLPQQQQLQFHEHEARRQQQLGASLLSQLSTQPSEVLQQQPAMPEPGQSLYKEKMEPVSEPQQAEPPIQQHHQPPVLQGPHSNERLQRSEQQSQSQKYGKAVQPQHQHQHQHQHQQAISSPIQQLSQSAPLVKDEAQHHHDPSLIKPVSEKPELQNLVLTPMASQQDFPEANTKNVEPGPLDEKSLLGCLLRVVPTEPNAKIRISTTLPNRLGKLLAPLRWHDYRKQYGRLDEFVNSHPELFVIDGDYIHLKKGAHAVVSGTTTTVAGAAATTGPIAQPQLPPVVVSPVPQVAELQRSRSLKGSTKDTKIIPAPQHEESGNAHKQRPPSPLRPKSSQSRQNHNTSMARNSVGNGTPTVAINSQHAPTGTDYTGNGLPSRNHHLAGFENGERVMPDKSTKGSGSNRQVNRFATGESQ